MFATTNQCIDVSNICLVAGQSTDGLDRNRIYGELGWTGPHQLKVAKFAYYHLLYVTLDTHIQFIFRFTIRYSLAGWNGDGDAFESGVQPSTARGRIGVAGRSLDGALALTSSLRNIKAASIQARLERETGSA